MAMEFEWDEAKSARTRQERGFDFTTAARIFEGPVVEWQDRRRDWGEDRIVAVGVVDGRFLTVIYTQRSERRRIISARVSRKTEKERWLSSEKP
jgi:uncharacterized DUF497 family protein